MNQLIRFGVFGMVGVVNTLFDLLIWKTIMSTVGQKPAFQSFADGLRLNSQSFAHSISFFCGTVLSYFLNSTITFQAKDRSAGQLLSFLAVSVFSWVVTTYFLKWLSSSKFGTGLKTLLERIENKISPKGRFVNKNWDLICKVITVFISLLTNYIGYSLFVFG